MKKHAKVPPTPSSQLDPPAVEIQLPMIKIPLQGVNLHVQQRGDAKVLTIGPVGLVLELPMQTDAARHIGGLLASGIEIPSGGIVERVGAIKP